MGDFELSYVRPTVHSELAWRVGKCQWRTTRPAGALWSSGTPLTYVLSDFIRRVWQRRVPFPRTVYFATVVARRVVLSLVLSVGDDVGAVLYSLGVGLGAVPFCLLMVLGTVDWRALKTGQTFYVVGGCVCILLSESHRIVLVLQSETLVRIVWVHRT